MLRIVGPAVSPGRRRARFFDGRLLTAEDLALEQQAGLFLGRMLAAATGAGVVEGLEVHGTVGRGPEAGLTLTVSAGMAFNSLGQTLCLIEETPLRVEVPPRGQAAGGAFGPVPPPSADDMGAPEVHALVARPLAGLGQGPHPRKERPVDAFASDGVEFRLLPLRLPPGAQEGTDWLRNVLAYRCYGVPDGDGLAGLCAGLLSLADVPLALIGWSCGGPLWLDRWAVRRRAGAGPGPGPWPWMTGAGTCREAMQLQFQEHLEDLRRQSEAPVVATQHFRYLPPCGALGPAGPGGSDWQSFFVGLPVQVIELDPAFRDVHLRRTAAADPVDLTEPVPIGVVVPVQEGDPAFFLRWDRSVLPLGPLPPSEGILVDVAVPGSVHGPASVRGAGPGGEPLPSVRYGRRTWVQPPRDMECMIWATAPGCRTVGRRIAYRRAERPETLGLSLRRAESTRAVPPEVECDAVLEGRAGRLRAEPERCAWGVLPTETIGWTVIERVDPAVYEWLRAWGAWFALDRPDLPVDADNPGLVLDAGAWDRREPTDTYAALAVFGQGGLHLPLRCHPAPWDQTDEDATGLIQPEAVQDPPDELAAATEALARRRPTFWQRLLGRRDNP